MTSHSRKLGALVAGVGTLSLSLMGVSAAFAAPQDEGPGQEGAPTTGALTIHKYAGSATTEEHPDGSQQSVDRPALAGVEFTIQRIGVDNGAGCVAIDLKTPAGWEDADAIVNGSKEGCSAGAEIVEVTNAEGIIYLPGQELGLYHVEETDAPETVATKAEPFYVTIPYPTEDTNNNPLFEYDVHVYPKNTLEEGQTEKTVTEPGIPGLGASLDWTIKTRPLGTFADGKKLKSYSITDSLDGRLTYVDGSAKLSVVTPDGNTSTPVNEEYYDLATPASAGGELKVTFNDDGIAWINTLPAGTRFVFEYSTTVTSLGSDGAILNEAIENGETEDGDPIDNTDNPGQSTTLWGDLKLKKHAHGDTDNTLAGAVFTVHEAKVDDDGEFSCAKLEDLGDAIKVTVDNNTVTEFTSDNNGEVHIPGLWVSNDKDMTSRDYCLVEKTAPAGYSKLSEPVQVTVNAGTTTTDFDREIPNSKASDSALPQLPLTGAGGTLLMTVGGLLLIAIGTGATLVARKHRRNTIDE